MEHLNDDAVICIFCALDISDILALRQTCKRMNTLSRMPAVWLSARNNHVIRHGFPISDEAESDDPSVLERTTIHAYKLGSRWKSEHMTPRHTKSLYTKSSTAITDVRFIPNHEGRWLLTVSKGIWSTVSIWDVTRQEHRLLGEWCPKSTLLIGLAVNSDPRSEAMIAASISKNDEWKTELYSFSETGGFKTLSAVSFPYTVSSFDGDMVALSDTGLRTVVWNWRKGISAVLAREESSTDTPWTGNPCVQILFGDQTIWVVHMRSVDLFTRVALAPSSAENPPPSFTPTASYNFGWVDGVSATLSRINSSSSDRLSVLVRTERTDLWATNSHRLDLYTVESYISKPDGDDYATEDDGEHSTSVIANFPPTLSSSIDSVRGSINYSSLALGRAGTALWIQPQDRSAGGLISDNDVHLQHIHIQSDSSASSTTAPGGDSSSCEALMAVVFPGPLLDEGQELRVMRLWENTANDFTCMAYDESAGRIAVGRSAGAVTILHL